MCDLRIEHPEASAEHALMRWRGGVWEIQDMHSRNGTFLDGRRIPPGREVVLEAGARLRFGYAEDFTLGDGGPPLPHAVALDSPHAPVVAEGDVLALPNAEEVEATVFRRERQWWLEHRDRVLPITDRSLVHMRSGAWWIYLPESPSATRDATDVPPSLVSLALTFSVGEDGAVALVAARGDTIIDLKTRTHHGLLLSLAQARLGDDAKREDAGWVDQEALLQRLGYDANRFRVEVHRIRRQLADAGVLDAASIIERRDGARQLRIGVQSLKIVHRSASAGAA